MLSRQGPDAMNWLMNVNWLAGPLLQIALLIFMVRRSFYKVFPRFFSYILFQTLKSACLFVTYKYFPESYFDAYWTGNAVSVIFTVVVMDEILHSLFKDYGGIQILGTTIFRWSCGLLKLRGRLCGWLREVRGSSMRRPARTVVPRSIGTVANGSARRVN